jgi:hypothetical protein
MTETNEVVIYQAEDGNAALEVQLDQDTVWLSQEQMAELFGREVLQVITAYAYALATLDRYDLNCSDRLRRALLARDGRARSRPVVRSFAKSGEKR